MAIPYIGQGDEIKASWLNQIVDRANGPDVPYDGQFIGTPKGSLLVQRPLGSERPEAQDPDIIFSTRVVPNCYPLTAYPFEYETEQDANEKHIFVNLGRSFQQLRASIQINGEPINQFVLLPESGTPEALVLSGPQDASLSDDNLSTELWLPAESEQLSAVADCNTGWVDTGFNGNTGGGIYLVVATIQNEEDDKPKSVAVITDIEAKRPEDAEAVLAELDSQGIIVKDDVTAVPIAEAMGGWTLSAEWGDGAYGQNGAYVWNCYTVGTQRASVGETPEDTMKPELKQRSVQRKKFTVSEEQPSGDEGGAGAGGTEHVSKSVVVRQLYNFNNLSSMDFPKLDVEDLSGLHWVLRLHKDDDEGGDEEEDEGAATKGPARSLKKSGLMKAGDQPAQEGEGEEEEGEDQPNEGTTKIVYSKVLHPDSFEGANGISSLQYEDYSDSSIEYSLFKFKDMEVVNYKPSDHDVLVRNHDGTLEYTDTIAISGDTNHYPDPSWCCSIETIMVGQDDDAVPCHQIYDFNNNGNTVSPTIGFIADGQPHLLLDTGIDWIIRNESAQQVEYHSPYYVLPDIDSLSDDIEEISSVVDELSGGLGDLQDEIRDLSGKYWPQGGTYTNCYGDAIGDRWQNKVIDLNDLVLIGDWTVDGNLSVEDHLDVKLSSHFGDNLAIDGDLGVLGEISAHGDITTDSDLIVGGDIFCEHGTLHLLDLEARNISCEELYAEFYLSSQNADFTGILSASQVDCAASHIEDLEVLSSMTVGPDVPVDIQGALFVGDDATFYADVWVGSGSLHVADTVEADIGEFATHIQIGSTTLDEGQLLDLLALVNQQRSLRSVPLGNVKFSTQLLVDQSGSQLSGT